MTLADTISVYYPIIITINEDNVLAEMHLVDKSMVPNVRLFTVIDWDIVAPEFTMSLDIIFKNFEGSPEVSYVEEITQEEYNNLRNEIS